jgi:hypothetical protein
MTVPSETLRRLRAMALNGIVWGGAWFFGVMTLATAANVLERRGLIVEGWELAVPGGILFAVAGIAFSAVITLVLRRRRLSQLKWTRFGLGGGVVSFFLLPTLVSVLRALSGDDMLPFTKLLGTGALGLMFGSVAAAGTLKLAQWADRFSPKSSTGAQDLLTGDQAAAPTGDPTRSAEREAR